MATRVSITEFGAPPRARLAAGRRLGRALALLAALLGPLALPAPELAAQGQPAPGVAAPPAELAAVRLGQQGRFTRVVLDLDRPVPFETRLERQPAQLVIDLVEPLGRVRLEPTVRPRGLARAVRGTALPGGGTRLAVELAGPAELVARFWIPPGTHSGAWRLVVDLEPEGAARPAPPAEPEPPLPRPRPVDAAAAFQAARAAAARPAPAQPAAARPAAAPVEAAAAAAREPARNGQVRPPGGRTVVAVDPGHGGPDPGTIGVDGLKEKDVVLAMGLELAEALEASGRYTALLTRRSDEGLALRERMRVARDGGAALFLSLHADSLADPQVAGASVYTLSETASDEEAAALASKENKADILTGTDLSRHDPIVASILIDLAQRDTLNKSIELAQALAGELQKVTPLLRNHRRFAGFAVLKSPETPSALIELGYLSSPEDARRLADPRHRRRLAQAILAAIDRHTGAVK